MDALDALDAFYLEHRRCGELDTGVDTDAYHTTVVWLACSCGARMTQSVETVPPIM